MATASSGAEGAVGQEPPMFLQRPSSAKSQDVQHVLAKTFRQLFTRDAVAPDTVHYLNKSRGGEDSYHEKYVEALQKVQEERERRMAEAAMLERHIMQAQARATSADEKQLNRMSVNSNGFPDLGLPPARAHFRSCIDTALLKEHNLITPEDYAVTEIPVVPPPSAPKVPLYARETHTSSKKKIEGGLPRDGWESPLLPALGANHEKFEVESDSDTASLNSLPRVIDSREFIADPAKKNLWKEQVNPEHREQHRKDLANLQGRVDYLKNTRYQPPSAGPGTRTLIKSHKKKPKEVGIKPELERSESIVSDFSFKSGVIYSLEDKPKEPSVIFIPSPENLTFAHYNVGQVYEMTLELKNVTTVLRPVRILPPKTQYFSMGLGQFPGEQGLIAPGMCCHYNISFAPDSLGNYDDEIVVQTQSNSPMVIKLEGRRPPPILTMPKVLDCGECLIGGVKIAQFEIKNEGGPGRFAMMRREIWPASNFKSVTSMGAVTVPPFEIRPSVFELNRNEKIILEVLFIPNEVESYSHNLTLVCDNCHVRKFSVKGQGQVASVELLSVEEGLSEPLPDELCDITAQHLVKFSKLNPFTYMQKKIVVKNTVNVDLPYNWIMVKPFIRARDPEGVEEVPIPSERIQDVDSAFSVEPDQGVLKSGAIKEFTLTFAPPLIQLFHSVMHLVLRGIPRPRPQSADTDEEEEVDPRPMIKVAEPNMEDVTALEIETKGECEPLSVMLRPYALHIPGQLMVQTAVKRQFMMINNSLTTILFQWENVSSESLILEVEPPVGELMPQCDMDFDLTICASQPGKVDHTLLCYVQHLDEPLTLHVDVEIKGPELVIEQSNMNLGLVRLGDTVQDSITIRNDSRVVARWWIKESPMHRSSEYADDSEFIFEPSFGEIKPLETKKVKVIFKPTKCQSLRSIFEVRVEDGNEREDIFAFLKDVKDFLGLEPMKNKSAISVVAEVQIPAACLLSSKLKMDEVYLDVPVCHQVELLNQTMLPTTFQWAEVSGKQAGMCSVAMEPSCGDLGPREKLLINVHFTSHTTGKISDMTLPCHIGGMEKPVFLMLKADVKGLKVSYKVMDENKMEITSEALCIEYGGISLGSVSRRFLYIKNESAITAPYSINVEHFFAKPPSPPEKRLDPNMPTKSQRRSMLAKTPNLADPLSKTPEKLHSDLSKMMLKEGKGAAFTTTPSSGILQPFSGELIEVTAFTDMWGEYQDRIICKVEKLDLVYVPVTMSVVGSPLHFQMCAAKPSSQPVLRFGTQVSGIAPLTRQMRINNSSPFDIRLDWQVFNEEDNKEHLVDMIVTYGKFFPEKDAKGNEIVPPLPAPPKRPRYPTDFILDTPDTSKANTELRDDDLADPLSLHQEDYRPKVIAVTLRPHEGLQSTKPYSINSSQVVIPARGNNCINVSFTPFSNSEITCELDCNGFALGYMSLTDKVACVEGCVQRQHGYSVNPLRFEMTAQVKPALLQLECTEDEGMKYWAAASDLMMDGQLQSETHKLCSATVSNTTLTPLDFRLITTEPFQIIELDRATRKPRLQLLQTNVMSLQPRQNLRVQVGFRISMDLLEYLQCFKASTAEDEGASEEVKSVPEGVEMEERDGERKLHFSQDLVVEFTNKTQQKLALYATLVLPCIVLSKTELDFGTCMVGQRREMQLLITNPTASASYWVASLEEKSSTCTDSTFEMTPSSGMLEAQVSFVSKNKTLLKVFFEAKHSEDYSAQFVFQGMLGEQPQMLVVKGTGSYDGKHEALVNV